MLQELWTLAEQAIVLNVKMNLMFSLQTKGSTCEFGQGLSASPQTSWLFPFRNKTLVFGGMDCRSPSDHVGQSEISKNKEVSHLPR